MKKYLFKKNLLKLSKSGHSLWCLNQEPHSLSPSSQLSETETLLQTVQSRTQGALSQRAISWKGQYISVSHSAPSYLLLRLYSGWGQPRGVGFLYYPQPPLTAHGADRDTDCSCGSWAGVSGREASQGDPGLLLPLIHISERSALKVGLSLRKKCTTVSTSSTRDVAHRFWPGEKHTIEQ